MDRFKWRKEHPRHRQGAGTSSFLGGFSVNRAGYAGVGGGVSIAADGTKALEVGVGLGGHGLGGGYGFSTESQPVQNGFTYLNDLSGGWLFGNQLVNFLFNTPTVNSNDPNGKLTTGFGNQAFIPPNIPISYNVYNENLA